MRTLLNPKGHDEWHGDILSSKCPLLREAIENAAINEEYDQVIKLIHLGEKYNYGQPSSYVPR